MKSKVNKWQAYIERDEDMAPDDANIPEGFTPLQPWKPVQFGRDFVGWRRPLGRIKPARSVHISWDAGCILLRDEHPTTALASLSGFSQVTAWQPTRGVSGGRVYWSCSGILDPLEAPDVLRQYQLAPKPEKTDTPYGFVPEPWERVEPSADKDANFWTRILHRSETKQ